jgi:LytS/YehU family sensor histidine kinase
LEGKYYLTFGLLPPLLIVYYYYEKKSFLKLYCFAFFSVIIFFNIAFGLSIMKLFFLIILFYISVIYFNNENLKKNELAIAKLRATKLETEMLKKIIQPHYIMNSLNAVIEWIEESPKEGLRFIKELSDEFRSFSTFSDKKSISIREELELCKNHLKIMEFRHHKIYKFDVKLDNLDQQIPPAILHTLIENGINHHPPNSNEICFRIEDLDFDKGFGLKIIVNYCNNSVDCKSMPIEIETETKKKFNLDNNIIEGNGLKYIRSRLTESYGENWELDYYGDEIAWITNIKIYASDLT